MGVDQAIEKVLAGEAPPVAEKLWTREDSSEYLGVPKQTMAKWAVDGYGPRVLKIGRHARYVPSEVRAWAAAQSSRPAPSAA